MIKTSTFVFLILVFTEIVSADDSCKFSRPPKLIKRVSADLHEHFSIRFRLKYFDEFCLLKVRIPRGTLVTFNLTSWVNWPLRGNMLGSQIQLRTHMYKNIQSIGSYLDIVNVDDDFGTRLGRYVINHQEVYGVPYNESILGVILDGYCSNNYDDTFYMWGKLRTTSSFQQCLQYNKAKGKNEGEYLFCRMCNKIPTFNRDNSMISFEMENVDDNEQLITCQIKTDDDQVNYDLRLIPTCAVNEPNDNDDYIGDQIYYPQLHRTHHMVVTGPQSCTVGSFWNQRRMKCMTCTRHHRLNYNPPCINLWKMTISKDDSCKFSRPPNLIEKVSADPHEHFRIRFFLKNFNDFCLLKVRIPGGTLVTFNLTSRVNWPLRGDRLGNQIQLRTNMYKKISSIGGYLDIVNVDHEFGTRLGRYVINQQIVYGVPNNESALVPITAGRCKHNYDDTFNIWGELGTTSSFQQCLEYNNAKGKNEEYLFCHMCKMMISVNRGNSMISFEKENVTEIEQYIHCQIKTDNDRVNYTLRFLPTCSDYEYYDDYNYIDYDIPIDYEPCL